VRIPCKTVKIVLKFKYVDRHNFPFTHFVHTPKAIATLAVLNPLSCFLMRNGDFTSLFKFSWNCRPIRTAVWLVQANKLAHGRRHSLRNLITTLLEPTTRLDLVPRTKTSEEFFQQGEAISSPPIKLAHAREIFPFAYEGPQRALEEKEGKWW
jgi:hypothetical protein